MIRNEIINGRRIYAKGKQIKINAVKVLANNLAGAKLLIIILKFLFPTLLISYPLHDLKEKIRSKSTFHHLKTKKRRFFLHEQN